MSKRKIIAAVDLVHKASDRHVVEEAILMAKTHDADVALAFVIPDGQHSYAQPFVSEQMQADVQREAEADLDAYAGAFDWRGVGFETHVLRGVVYEKLVAFADDLPASAVVIGANRPTVTDFFMGPNAARVARQAACNVLVVRPLRD